jgi:predicted RNA-binding protein with PUA-like domain
MVGQYLLYVLQEKTLVFSKSGLIPIEDIKVGDSVYFYNLNKNKSELSKVVNTSNRKTEAIYEIKTDKEVISVTAEHPIYVIGKGFRMVKDLKAGDLLKSYDFKKKVHIKVIRNLFKEVMVYNIEVDGNHDYFVSSSTILVHNKNISKRKKVKFDCSSQKNGKIL